jgi:zinc transport system ATP-binding protein
MTVAPRPTTPSTVAGDVLSVRDVTFGYGREPVLSGVGFGVSSGEFVALVGPNGSGKSTLLRILLGLLTADAGTVQLFGDDPRRLRNRGRVGYVPQRPTLPTELPATVEEVVASGLLARRGWRGRRRPGDPDDVDHALESVGLVELRRHRLAELSGGQQQRAFIAKALVTRPDLLVLDEPVAGVDAESQRRFSESLTHLVREHGAAVLLVSHELGPVADELDRVIVLKRRVLFDGPPSELSATGVSLGVHREDLPLWLEGLAE